MNLVSAFFGTPGKLSYHDLNNNAGRIKKKKKPQLKHIPPYLSQDVLNSKHMIESPDLLNFKEGQNTFENSTKSSLLFKKKTKQFSLFVDLLYSLMQ